MTQKNIEKIACELQAVLDSSSSFNAFEKFLAKYPPNIVDQVMERIH